MFAALALASLATAEDRVFATQYIRITRVQDAAVPTSYANGTAASNGTVANGTAPTNGTASNGTAATNGTSNGTSASNSTSSSTTAAANGGSFSAPQLAAVAIGAAALLL